MPHDAQFSPSNTRCGTSSISSLWPSCEAEHVNDQCPKAAKCLQSWSLVHSVSIIQLILFFLALFLLKAWLSKIFKDIKGIRIDFAWWSLVAWKPFILAINCCCARVAAIAIAEASLAWQISWGIWSLPFPWNSFRRTLFTRLKIISARQKWCDNCGIWWKRLLTFSPVDRIEGDWRNGPVILSSRWKSGSPAWRLACALRDQSLGKSQVGSTVGGLVLPLLLARSLLLWICLGQTQS